MIDKDLQIRKLQAQLNIERVKCSICVEGLTAIKNSNDLVKGYDDINETLKEEEKLITKTIDAHNFSTIKKI